MQTITKTYRVFSFDELSEDAKEKAISDHISFMLETADYDSEFASENFKKAIDHCEQMLTPWFVGNYIYDYCKDEIIETILINEYQFTEDGKLF